MLQNKNICGNTKEKFMKVKIFQLAIKEVKFRKPHWGQKLTLTTRTMIVKVLINIPPKSALSTKLHSFMLLFPWIHSCFSIDPAASSFSALFCRCFRFLGICSMKLCLVWLGATMVSLETPLFSGVLWLQQLLPPQSQDFGSSEQQLSEAHELLQKEDTTSWSGIFLLEAILSFFWLSVSITCPKTDHLPTDVILTITEVPSIESGPATRTCIYPLVWPTLWIEK